MLPFMIQLKPSWMPTTSKPERTARMVAAPMTALMPGAGPPPTRMPTFLGWWVIAPTISHAGACRRYGFLDALVAAAIAEFGGAERSNAVADRHSPSFGCAQAVALETGHGHLRHGLDEDGPARGPVRRPNRHRA